MSEATETQPDAADPLELERQLGPYVAFMRKHGVRKLAIPGGVEVELEAPPLPAPMIYPEKFPPGTFAPDSGQTVKA